MVLLFIIHILTNFRNCIEIDNKTLLFQPVQDYSDSEIQSRVTKRTISVFDLIPGDNLRSDLFTGRSKAQPR